MPPGDLQNRIHVCRLAIEMDWHDRFGAWCDGGFDPGRVDVECPRVWLHRHWCGTCIRHRQPCGDKRVTRNNDFVARSDSVSPQDQVKGIEPVSNGDAVPGFTICCK